MKQRSMPVPESLKHPLFFPSEEVVLPDYPSVSAEPFFIYEFSSETEQPWLHEEHGMPLIAAEWSRLKVRLEEKFQQRDRKVHDEMKAAIALFFMELFWSNKLPVQLNGWQQEVKKLDVKPVNIGERLGFVLKRPYSYHSYVQLSELMAEQKKQAAIYKLFTRKK